MQPPTPSFQRTRQQWLRTVRGIGVTPARSMGQNFLIEPDVVRDIVNASEVGADDLVVEIGPGLGILTRELLDRGTNVIAIELDHELATFLASDLALDEGFTVVERDARHADIESLVGGAPYHVVANLPYSTGTAILRRLLELEHPPRTITVMVQREVAERMVAAVPNMSLLSIAVQLYAEAELMFGVPPDVFVPPPKVESAVVRLKVRKSPMASSIEIERIFRFATKAFQRRRKTIANGLAQGLEKSKPDVDSLLVRAGIDPRLRPQAIDLDGWVRLARIAER